MPSLSPVVSTTQTVEVKLTPAIRRKLLVNLKAYGALKAQKDAIEHAMKGHKETLSGIMDTVEETSLSIEGYKTTLVAPVRKVLDPKRLVALGVSMETIHAATTETPTTPYIKVTCPGGDDD